VTGVTHDWKKASATDRALIKEQVAGMNADLNKAIVRAIQQGEARAKEVEEKAISDTDIVKKQSLVFISEEVEDMADNVFKLVQGGRQQVADNYLSLKAYAASSADQVQDYVSKGKGRNLGSIGDLLQTIGALSDVKVGKSEGIGAGASSIPLVFSGKMVKVANPVNKINFLVNEYINTLNQVQSRWPMGLGKYLLNKVERNMQKKGVLEVDRLEGKTGNHVFINAHSVGLSSRLSDFEELAVHMTVYQRILSKLTAKTVPKHAPTSKAAKEFKMGPPEWDGK